MTLRPFRIFLSPAIWLLSALAAWAQCAGTDLIEALPAESRAALRAEADAAPHPQGILWKAERKTEYGAERVYLVGTMHFHDPRHADTLARVRPWIEEAGAVFLELGEGDEQRLQARLAAEPGLAFIVEGPTLPQLMPPEDWQRLKSAMQLRGVPGFLAAKMQPWMALVTLGMSQCAMAQAQAGQRGLDMMIADLASRMGKPPRGLEPYDTALSIFGSYSQEEMLEFLTMMVRQENFDPEDQHSTMVEAYFREEARLLWEFGVFQALADPQGMTEQEIRAEYARMEEALIGARNRQWIPRIVEAAREGPVLVAAGALHMPGEKGVLRLLEREGFVVTRVPLTP